MSEMKVGDIGVLQNIVNSPWLNGCVVEVVGGLEYREGKNPDGTSNYDLKYIVITPLPIWGEGGGV